jgi:hypothetical protein
MDDVSVVVTGWNKMKLSILNKWRVGSDKLEFLVEF